jgi:hypothetical protein
VLLAVAVGWPAVRGGLSGDGVTKELVESIFWLLNLVVTSLDSLSPMSVMASSLISSLAMPPPLPLPTVLSLGLTDIKDVSVSSLGWVVDILALGTVVTVDNI